MNENQTLCYGPEFSRIKRTNNLLCLERHWLLLPRGPHPPHPRRLHKTDGALSLAGHERGWLINCVVSQRSRQYAVRRTFKTERLETSMQTDE